MDLTLRPFFLALIVVTSPLTACDMAAQIAESNAHATPIEAEIESAVGKKPRVSSASNGPVLVVMVRFSEVPSLPVPALEVIARAAIVHEFKKQPTSLTIAFVYDEID